MSEQAVVEERVRKIAEARNEKNMKRCVNRGQSEACCAPFCEYCSVFKAVKPLRELVEEWKMMSRRTRESAIEKGDLEAKKLSIRTVCDNYDTFLHQMEKSLEVYGDEATQDRMMARGGAK